MSSDDAKAEEIRTYSLDATSEMIIMGIKMKTKQHSV